MFINTHTHTHAQAHIHAHTYTLVQTQDILADPGAYLSAGSISRYHNPDNYTSALGRLIFLKRKGEGKFPSWMFKV